MSALNIEQQTSKSNSFNWRDHLKVHPAAEMFPLMSEPELRELGEDIRRNGLKHSIAVWVDGPLDCNDLARFRLIDGRNRLAAMELVGVPFQLTFEQRKGHY
jgi:ParB-like chromosome segregation protein Spo0J